MPYGGSAGEATEPVVRFAALSDVHGNLPALEAVIEHIAFRGVRRVVNLGDCLSGPLWPVETGRLLMSLGWPTVAGNHDRQLVDRPLGEMGRNDAYAAARIDGDLRRWLSDLPPVMTYAGDVLLCHGSPSRDDAPWLHRGVRGDMREATEQEAGEVAFTEALALCGHTHLARVVHLPDGRVVANAGSVGFPARQDGLPTYHADDVGEPRARYLIAERHGRGWVVELQAVAYDHEAAARRAERNGGGKWARALRTGRMPPKLPGRRHPERR